MFSILLMMHILVVSFPRLFTKRAVINGLVFQCVRVCVGLIPRNETAKSSSVTQRYQGSLLVPCDSNVQAELRTVAPV